MIKNSQFFKIIIKNNYINNTLFRLLLLNLINIIKKRYYDIRFNKLKNRTILTFNNYKNDN